MELTEQLISSFSLQINLPIIFSMNWSIVLSIKHQLEVKKNLDNITEPKLMSLNCLFYLTNSLKPALCATLTDSLF